MLFEKDILLIDFETTGLGPDFSDPIQLGAVLLDKKTLDEKDSFSSFIYSESALSPAVAKKGQLPVEKIRSAPSLPRVAKEFIDKFGFDVLLSSWVFNLDKAMLSKLLNSIKMPIDKFDYHCLDLWPIAYLHLIKNGYTGSIRSEEMFRAFGFSARGENHDALEDCRIEAGILRKIALG